MGEQRSAANDVLTLEQYRELLRTAARIEEREKSITIFFFAVVLGRAGLRVGEALHMTKHWYKEDRGVIAIPLHHDCECGYCDQLAKTKAEDNEDLTVEEAREDYWKSKEGPNYDVPAQTSRMEEIVNLYFEEVPYSDISYSTVLRRLKKMGQLLDGVRPKQVYPHMLRATSVTHDLWAGAKPATVDVKYRWADEKTKESYAKKSAIWAAKDLARLRNDDDATDRFSLRNNPPTYTELRPDDPEKLITVDSWEVPGGVRSHPRHDEDEWIQETLPGYADDGGDPVASVVDPVTATASTAHALVHQTVSRLRTEWNAIRDESADWPTPREAAAPLLKSALGFVMMAVVFSITGFTINPVTGEVSFPPAVVGAGMVLGAAVSIWLVLWADYRARIEDVAFTRWLGQSLPV